MGLQNIGIENDQDACTFKGKESKGKQ